MLSFFYMGYATARTEMYIFQGFQGFLMSVGEYGRLGFGDLIAGSPEEVDFCFAFFCFAFFCFVLFFPLLATFLLLCFLVLSIHSRNPSPIFPLPSSFSYSISLTWLEMA